MGARICLVGVGIARGEENVRASSSSSSRNENKTFKTSSPRFVVIPPRPCLFIAAFFLRRAWAILAAAEDLKTLPWAIGFEKVLTMLLGG